MKSDKQDKIKNKLTSQGFIVSFIWENTLKQTSKLWPAVQSKMPKNIFNFTVRYLNNSIPVRKNMYLWKKVTDNSCSFCLQPETLNHVVAGCKTYLDEKRYNWRHDSVLFMAKTLSFVSNYCIYADLIGFDSPSIVTDNENRLDCILRLTGEHDSRELYIIELTVGFETNLQKNALRKEAKYSMLLSQLRQQFDKVFFVNLSLSALGFYDSSCSSFTDMLKHLKFTEEKRTFILKRTAEICIRTTYYIFCR